MSTSNKQIFTKFLSLIDDKTLCSLLTDKDMTELLSLFLNGSVSLYFKNCKKDLSSRIYPNFLREEFVANGTDNTFVISEYPTNVNLESLQKYCTVNDSIANYTFDELTKTYTISPTPSASSKVVCGYDYIGEFVEDLNDEECWILAHGMIIVWFSSKLFSERKLKERLSSKDYNALHSPANLLEKMENLYKFSLIQIRNLSVSYSFNGFKGFN